MFRFLFVELLIVTTPITLFLLYRAFVRMRKSAAGDAFNPALYRWLFFIGALSAVAALVVHVIRNPSGEYVPFTPYSPPADEAVLEPASRRAPDDAAQTP